MIVGIVGHEEAKFTPRGYQRALATINQILTLPDVTEVVSGRCPLGGIDIWAADRGRYYGLVVTEFAPKTNSWETGFKPRNLQIASRSDAVYSIVVDKLPATFTGRRFEYCYHCHQKNHVKSGGCWTMHQAVAMGKQGYICIVENY